MSRRALWYVRDTRLPSGLWAVRAFATEEHDDGTVVDAAAAPGQAAPWVWRTFEAERGMLRFEFDQDLARTAPSLWFVNVDEPRGPNPSTHLVAFTTEHVAPGTIVDRFTFASLGVHNDLQVGAVQWSRSGIARQVFIAPPWRRRSAATVLLLAADAFHQANAWPGYLRSDGRRTRLGNLLVDGIPFSQRVAPLTETMPPMDPA